MSADAKHTDRDLILARREGWVDCRIFLTHAEGRGAVRPMVLEQAAERYPLPKVTRLREVKWDGTPYRWDPDRGRLEFMKVTEFGKEGVWAASGWEDKPLREVPDRILEIRADLRQSPWEEVEDE